jgi:DNA polymerase III delta prime subunit
MSRKKPDASMDAYNQILQREQIVKEITDILQSFDEKCRNITFKKGIYIYGSPGCGKTQFICNLLESLHYDVIKYDAGDVRNKALIDTITCNNVSNRNVLSMMNRNKKPIAIVMDEIDEMNNGDKRGITSLIKLIRQKKTKKQKMEQVTLNPIICIGNYYVDKKMKELKKVCNVFELKTPTHSQMSSILDLITTKASVTILPEIKETILKFVQGDMRKLVFIQNILHTRPQFLEDHSILQNIFQIKTYNDDAKKITHRLLNEYVPLDQHNQILNETDRTIISLLYHENIIDPLWSEDRKSSTCGSEDRKSSTCGSEDRKSSTCGSEDRKSEDNDANECIRFYNQFLDNLCFADYIDRVTFQNQIWIFNEMSSMIKTFYNNWLYHHTFSHTVANFQPSEVRFTKVLTKYSTEYNNQLFLYNMCQELDMDKKDVVAFFQELRILLGGSSSVVVYEHLDDLFQSTDITRLDIKRMYRFLDKNSDTFDLIGGKKITAASLPHMEDIVEDDEGGDDTE